MIHSKFHSILPRKWYRNMIFSKKMHNGENAFEVLLYLYKQCKHHTKYAFSVYKLIYFGNMSYTYGKFDRYMEMSTTKNSLKQIPPEIRPATPLKRRTWNKTIYAQTERAGSKWLNTSSLPGKQKKGKKFRTHCPQMFLMKRTKISSSINIKLCEWVETYSQSPIRYLIPPLIVLVSP